MMYLKMSRLFGIALLVLIPALSLATGLPPEHEAKRLMLAAQKSIESEQWDKAEQQLKRIATLDVPLPAQFHYMHGQVLFHKSEFDMAQKSFEVYVLQAGEEGEFYVSALEMITETDENKNKVKPKLPTPAELTLDKPKDEYLIGLKKLYLTDDDQEALVLQINSILSSNPYTGARIKQKGSRKGIRYEIKIIGKELQVQEKHYDKTGAPTLVVNRMDVFGVDPFIRYDCDYDRYVCWLYHPVNQYDRWILLDRNDAAAKELSGAMGRLIRFVQGG